MWVLHVDSAFSKFSGKPTQPVFARPRVFVAVKNQHPWSHALMVSKAPPGTLGGNWYLPHGC